MKVTFLGAAHDVTGSCTLLEAGDKRILIDYGMEQGRIMFETQRSLVNPKDIDCVLLTHAHIDHSGNLPLLYKEGFRGTVYSTEATYHLCEIMLMDSAHIQMAEVDRKNRKAKRSGADIYEPIYDFSDVAGILSRFRPCKYEDTIRIQENIEVRFVDAGHLLGSSFIEIWLSEGSETRKIVFSGDVGNINKPIIKSPQNIEEADYVVIESTYGNREHEVVESNFIGELAGYIQKTLDRGGNVVIPSFAVGRTQELLYFIRQIKNEGLIRGHKNFKVYLDSPLAQEATGIFLQCDPDIFDDEAKSLIQRGVNPLFFDGLNISVTSQESVAINTDPDPVVIISASGMCEAGRVRHHLKHNLWRKECLILFAGYQTDGTLGRQLIDKAKSTVKIFDEDIAVNAEIGVLHNTSGHADRKGLTAWLDGYVRKPGLVFVNHGTEESCEEFVEYLKNERGYNATSPYSGTVYDLLTGQVTVLTEGIRIKPRQTKIRDPRAVKVFNRLIEAVSRLSALAHGSEGMSNKEIAKFADQVDQMVTKWSR
ncbi:MAG: MBL fold metallo-hydrolase [Oscillospiraceae bacterium]|nr:MBL fold metallo-hydrolase [Oscillospiraceae bacterium]